MTIRHEVANLRRRGNIWYWRPRVPKRFSQSRLNERMSLSLGQSDHRRAQFMARRLNTMLAELKMRMAGAMTAKDTLNKLFKAEIESMNAMMSDIAMAAQALGDAAEPANLRADVEVGWGDLPLNFHPAATGVLLVFTPIGAG